MRFMAVELCNLVPSAQIADATMEHFTVNIGEAMFMELNRYLLGQRIKVWIRQYHILAALAVKFQDIYFTGAVRIDVIRGETGQRSVGSQF